MRAKQKGLEEWEWHLALIFCSIVFLLVAIMTGIISYPERWREGVFWLGVGLGAITPLGRLIYLSFDWLEERFGWFANGEGWGCTFGCLCLFFGPVITILGIVAGIILLVLLPVRVISETHLIGYVLSISGGVGAIEMAKNSYGLYRFFRDT